MCIPLFSNAKSGIQDDYLILVASVSRHLATFDYLGDADHVPRLSL